MMVALVKKLPESADAAGEPATEVAADGPPPGDGPPAGDTAPAGDAVVTGDTPSSCWYSSC